MKWGKHVSHNSHLTLQHTSLLLLIIVGIFDKIAPAATSSNNRSEKAEFSSLLLTPGPASIQVSWTVDNQENVTVSGYKVTWRDKKLRGELFVEGHEGSVLSITGLKPCTTYDVSVTTDNESGTTWANNTTTLVKEPSAVLRLLAHNITARSLALSWERPPTACEITAYTITYSGVAKWEPRTEHTNSTMTIVIDGLKPYTNYTVMVAASTEAGKGAGSTINATTEQDAPSKPVALTTSSGNQRIITATWREPLEINGVLGQYNISWYRDNETVGNAVVTRPVYSIDGLSPCVKYTVRVTASTGAGEGEYAEDTHITRGTPEVRNVTCSTESEGPNIIVKWMEHDRDCPIMGYEVIDPIANTTAQLNSTTYHHALNITQTIDLSVVCVASSREEARGNWTCCEDDKLTDRKIDGMSKKTLTIILGATVGGTVVMISVITLLCILCKRTVDSISATDQDYYDNLVAAVKQSAESLRHPAAAAGHFENLNKESYAGEITVAMRPANINKNLYSNVLPFDYNRVELKRFRSNLTDYINASFVKSSVEGDVCFIACQSPKSSTVDDFWWMVWEQSVQIIVMLVRSDDPEMTKSIQYWPGPGEEVCSSFSVTIVKKEIDYTLVKRKFHLSRGQETRTLHHFQLVSWPEFGVPNTENELLMLMRDVREHIGRHRHPVVVHCSAGVGQTGTFIGLWQLQVKADQMLPGINVKDTVLDMRKHRQMLVQRPVQYQFLHVCFLAYLQDRENWRPRSGRTRSSRRRRSSNRRTVEANESACGTELPLVPKHPDFGPLPPLPPSATSDDYATKNELDSDNPYYYPDISDEFKEEIISGTT